MDVAVVSSGEMLAHLVQSISGAGWQAKAVDSKPLHGLDQCKQALEGVKVVVIALQSDFEYKGDGSEEVNLGKNLGDACKSCGVEHILMNTYSSVQNAIGVPAKHYDAKSEIYDYMRSTLKLTITGFSIPPFYHLLITILQPTQLGPNNFLLNFPTSCHNGIDMIDMQDVGPCVCSILSNLGESVNKTICLSGQKLTGVEVAQTLSEVLAPKEFKLRRISVEEMREFGFPGAVHFANMFEFLGKTPVKGHGNVTLTQNIYSDVKNFRQWAEANTHILNQRL